MRRKNGANDEVIAFALTLPGWYERRVLPKIDTSGDCWTWTGGKSFGYGIMNAPVSESPSDRYRTVKAHRVVWIALRGLLIPDGMLLDHDGPKGCHNRACVNPAHLVIATPQENVLSGFRPNLLTCPAGHPRGEYRTVAPGVRRCLHCIRAQRIVRDAYRRNLWNSAAAALGKTQKQYLADHGYSIRTALEMAS